MQLHLTMYKILKCRSLIQKASFRNKNLQRKRKRDGKSANFEQAVSELFIQDRRIDAPLNRAVLMEKAEDFGKK